MTSVQTGRMVLGDLMGGRDPKIRNMLLGAFPLCMKKMMPDYYKDLFCF